MVSLVALFNIGVCMCSVSSCASTHIPHTYSCMWYIEIMRVHADLHGTQLLFESNIWASLLYVHYVFFRARQKVPKWQKNTWECLPLHVDNCTLLSYGKYGFADKLPKFGHNSSNLLKCANAHGKSEEILPNLKHFLYEDLRTNFPIM